MTYNIVKLKSKRKQKFKKLNYFSENTMMSGVSMDDLPPCMEKSAFNGMCKNRRQLTCFNIPVQNCPMCYCADHEYTGLCFLQILTFNICFESI